MVFRTLDYIQGKDASDIQTVLYHYDNSKTAQMDAKGIRLQVADNRIYASVRDIFREEAILRYKKGFTDQKPGSDGDFLWFPIEQRIHKTKNLDYAFQAGYQHCLDGIDTADIAIHDSDAALLAPARLVWGEIMIPVYDFRSGESNRWHAWNGDWDGKTKTLTIRTYYPDGRLS